MQQAIGSHFTVSFEGPAEAELAAEALEVLDRAYWRVGQLLGTYPTDPVPVVLYTTEQFRDITRSPAWAAGAYDGTIRVPMRGALEKPAGAGPRALPRVRARAGPQPRVARRADVAERRARDRARKRRSGLGREARCNASSGPGAAARAAVRLRATSAATQAQLAYATSALAARRLLEEAGGFAVANLLRDLGDGVDFDTAFLHRIQRSFADFQATPF